MKRPDFGDDLKIVRCFFPGVKEVLLTAGVQLPAKIFRLPQGPLLGLTNGALVGEY
jgi:hypothetical protein